MARPRKQPAGAQPSLLTADAAPLPELPVAEQPYPLPTGWKWVRLGDVLTPSKEKTEKFSPSLRYVGLEHIEKNNGIIDSTSAEGIRSLKNIFHPGQILYGKLRPYLNKHDIAKFSGVCSTDILVFNCRKDVYNKFANYTFNLSYFTEYAIANSKGINLPRVSEQVILNAPFPLPPREEQERIVARIESLFARLDEAREKVDAVVDGYETRRAALLHKAFSGELTAKWREEKGVDINGWKRVQLGDVYQINPKVAAHDDTPVSFVPMEKISSGMTGNFTFEIMPWGKAKKGHTRFADGDVAFAKISPCFENGKSMLVHGLENGIGAGTTELIVLRQPNILQKYTFYLISSTDFIQKGIQTYSGTVGQQRISMDFVRAYPIPLPTLPEQEEIVRLLDSLLERERQIREAAEQVRERIDLMKKAILARAFRGELG